MKVKDLIEHLRMYNPEIPVRVVNLNSPKASEEFEIVMCGADPDTEDDDIWYDYMEIPEKVKEYCIFVNPKK